MDSTDDRLDIIEAMLTDIYGQLRAIRESRNDGLATLNKGIDDLRQRIEAKFAKSTEEHVLNLMATDARMDRLSGILNEHERRLDKLDEQMTAALGITIAARPRPATPIEQAIVEINDRLDRFAIELGGKAITRAEADFGHSNTFSKPTIKGGWLNIYYNDQHRRAMVGAFCDTKDEADRIAGGRSNDGRRIACIRIPDITEGEGL